MYQIEIIRAMTDSLKFRKFANNPITGKPHQFSTIDDAQCFADSMKLHHCMHRTITTVPTYYRVVEMTR